MKSPLIGVYTEDVFSCNWQVQDSCDQCYAIPTWVQWATPSRGFPAILHMLSDLASVLHCLHDAHVVHRDVKPKNILWMLHSQTWRLIDLGIAAHAGAPRLRTGPSIILRLFVLPLVV
jgi:serine/threonine protein kinase